MKNNIISILSWLTVVALLASTCILAYLLSLYVLAIIISFICGAYFAFGIIYLYILNESLKNQQ